MTDVPPLPVVQATQADREAGADIYRRFRYGVPRLPVHIRDGHIEGDPIVQAFAAHRLASQAPLLAQLEGLTSVVEDCVPVLEEMLNAECIDEGDCPALDGFALCGWAYCEGAGCIVDKLTRARAVLGRIKERQA